MAELQILHEVDGDCHRLCRISLEDHVGEGFSLDQNTRDAFRYQVDGHLIEREVS